MKKIIALIMALALCLSACAAVAESTPELDSAKAYLYQLYKNPSRKDIKSTGVDYEVLGVVPVDGVNYKVEWSVDTDAVKVVVSEDGAVTINVDEFATADLLYTLTATVKDEAGHSASVSFQRMMPASMAGMSYAEIVDYAYTLADGEKTDKTYRLFGTIVNIPTAYSEQYGNITVDIHIEGKEDMPIQCYRLKGEGVADLKVGDQITVEGILTRYKTTFEFAAGCTLIGYGEIPSQQAILDAAYALGADEKMGAPTALEGTIVKIVSAYSEKYGNITVDMVCDGREDQIIQCYRLAGEGVADLKEGDVISVMGTIKNYAGKTVEFDQGCVLLPAGTAHDVRTAMSCYTLAADEKMPKESKMTGVITSIDTAWNEKYGNITVTIVAGGQDAYKIQCYRLAGEGAADLQVGDIITVKGTFKNYAGKTYEFDAGCQLLSVVRAK